MSVEKIRNSLVKFFEKTPKPQNPKTPHFHNLRIIKQRWHSPQTILNPSGRASHFTTTRKLLTLTLVLGSKS